MSSMPADAESSVKERKPRQMSRTDSEASSTTSRDSSASLHNHHNDPFLRPHLIPQKRFRTLSTLVLSVNKTPIFRVLGFRLIVFTDINTDSE